MTKPLSNSEIALGNITHTKGVAIGEGANVNITDINVALTAPEIFRLRLGRPAPVENFQGRKTELARLFQELQPGNVITICGPGGIGKTALASKAIWTLFSSEAPSKRFPDGIFFHSFYSQPQTVIALRQIAQFFGENPSGAAGSARSAAQRALSQRTALLFLDGAEEADDLPAILDIRNRCGVLITSRNRSDALGNRIDLAPLPSNDAVSLLEACAKSQSGDPETNQYLAKLVGYLPLAVHLAGCYLAESEIGAEDYCKLLETSPLDALDQGDKQSRSVSLLLQRSLTQVSETAQAALAVTGCLAFEPFPADAVTTALNMESHPQTKMVLGELVSYGILIRYGEGYKLCHSLIHTYARERLTHSREAAARLVKWILKASGCSGDNLSVPVTLGPHIITVQQRCVEKKMWQEVCDLASCILGSLDLQGLLIERIKMAENALAASRAAEAKRSEGVWLGNLGNAYADLGSMDKAINYYEQARPIFQEIEAQDLYGNHLGNLGLMYVKQGRFKEAIDLYQQALAISKEIGDKENQAHQLGNLGSLYTTLERVEDAISYHQQALTISKEISNERYEAHQLGNLGVAYRNLGEIPRAITLFQQALDIALDIGDKRAEGLILGHLGKAYIAQGAEDEGIDLARKSVAILEKIGSPDSLAIREWLNER